VRGNLEDVKVHGFAEGSALSDKNDISFFDGEGGGDVSGDIAVSLLISVVFWDVVEVIATDNDSALHLGGDNDALQDLAANGNVACERAFLVNIVRFNSLFGGLEV
jgi:hypothetical protein